MTVILGFLSSIGFVLLVGFGWLYLCRLLLRTLEMKLQTKGLAAKPRGSQYSPERGQRGKALMIFKLLIAVSSFLVVGVVVSFFLLPYPTYLVVSWVVLIIFFSNILNQELRSYYGIGIEQVLTTLHLAAVKVSHRKRPQITEHAPDLRSITDTTAYLNVLRQTFKPVRKKEIGRDDQHK